jgi:uncharacterized pyridoxal phosphate-containing UPF0001 family protein
MYMRRNVADSQQYGLSHADALHGYITASRQAYRIEMPGLSAFPPPELRFNQILERDEQVARWIELTSAKLSQAQTASVGGRGNEAK